MKRVCSWCKRNLITKEHNRMNETTHGICNHCYLVVILIDIDKFRFTAGRYQLRGYY